jgi:ankyrin repeat protein
VTVAPGGDLVFRSRWEFSEFAGAPVEKGPDEGNPKMYVVDAKARRLDHVTTTEAARLGGLLSRDKPVLRGDFVFRPTAVDPPFTFHDGDNNVAIEGIRLDASRKGDTEGRGNARLRARLAELRKADEVVVDLSWGGLGKPWAKGSVLRRAGPGSSGPGAVPAATMDAFLERLASAPLVEGPYFPRYEHTDDFPGAAIRFGSGDDALVVFSESQGAERIPWALQFEGRRYVIPSDAPARALDIVQTQIAEAEIKVARGEESPAPAPSGRAGTLASALILAAGRGDVAEVRRLLAAGADPGRGDDENGDSAVHAAASVGHAEILTLFADAGVALDVPDFRGLTPLLLAASAGRPAAARLLVERGARSQLAQALGSAAAAGHVEVVRTLLQAGAPANARGDLGLTALMAAMGARGAPHPDVMSALLDSGADVNAVDMLGRTALRHLVDSALPCSQTPASPSTCRIFGA